MYVFTVSRRRNNEALISYSVRWSRYSSSFNSRCDRQHQSTFLDSSFVGTGNWELGIGNWELGTQSDEPRGISTKVRSKLKDYGLPNTLKNHGGPIRSVRQVHGLKNKGSGDGGGFPLRDSILTRRMSENREQRREKRERTLAERRDEDSERGPEIYDTDRQSLLTSRVCAALNGAFIASYATSVLCTPPYLGSGQAPFCFVRTCLLLRGLFSRA
jgi:hypothetical protein